VSTITWLHLSDLHFKSGTEAERFNRRTVLEALWNDIRTQIHSGLKPDFIIFSGDVAYHGKKSEFDSAAKDFFDPLLEITSLSKDRLFIVPGNHDIDRKEITPAVREGMLAQLDDRDRINQFLSQKQNEERIIAFKKFSAYAKFIQSYFEGHLTFGDEDYFYTKTILIQGYKLAILGLNSAWMCGYGKDYKGEIFDLDHLLIGEWQLERALEKTKEADWRIAVVHHPITWLNENDHLQIRRRLEAKCNFILHGHLHRAEVYDTRSLSGHTVYIPCGAVYASRDYPNGYNFVNINLDSLKGKVYLRKYNDNGPRGPEWIKDIDSTGEENNGTVDFNFSRKTSEGITQFVEPVKKIIHLPVVIIAMTKKEAKQLFANKKNSDIAKLYKLIKNLNIQDIIDHYDIKDKDKWRPFGTSPYNIREILENFAQETEIPANHHSFRVKFEFHTDLFFNNNPAIKLQVLETLKSNGCLFMIDGLSMFHSEIFSRFLSYISGVEAPLVQYIISPIDFRKHELSQLFESHIDKFLPRFFIDHDLNLSPYCSFCLGNKVDLSRDMKTSLKELNLTGAMMVSWQEAFVKAGISGAGHMMLPWQEAFDKEGINGNGIEDYVSFK